MCVYVVFFSVSLLLFFFFELKKNIKMKKKTCKAAGHPATKSYFCLFQIGIYVCTTYQSSSQKFVNPSSFTKSVLIVIIVLKKKKRFFFFASIILMNWLTATGFFFFCALLWLNFFKCSPVFSSQEKKRLGKRNRRSYVEIFWFAKKEDKIWILICFSSMK